MSEELERQKSENPSDLMRVIASPGTPDIYAEGSQIFLDAYGVTIYLFRKDHVLESGEHANNLVGKVRMSHAQAWVFSQILSQLLDRYTTEVGPIALPEKVVQERGLEDAYSQMHKKGNDDGHPDNT